jgi:hypothetical protein
MAMGWCKHCDRLKHIRPVGQFEGRQVHWKPVPHTYLECQVCLKRRSVLQVSDDEFICPTCGVIDYSECKQAQCPGTDKVV